MTVSGRELPRCRALTERQLFRRLRLKAVIPKSAQHTPQSERLILALPFRNLPVPRAPSFPRLLSFEHALNADTI